MRVRGLEKTCSEGGRETSASGRAPQQRQETSEGGQVKNDSGLDFDVAIIGGGAAGMMAALFAGRERTGRVALLETTRDGGRKILISGGGRCNLLPSQLEPSQYVTSSSPNSLRKILLSWPLREQIAFFESDLGIQLALEEESGKLFPVSNRAREVRDTLAGAVVAAGVRRLNETRVEGIADDGEGWVLSTSAGPIRAGSVVMATGGLSVPQTGSDGRGLSIVRGLGHTIAPTYPALTPLTCEPPTHADLAGISLRVRLSSMDDGRRFEAEGGFLFTHRGYSGPAVLNISHLATTGPGRVIHAAWGGLDEEAWLQALGAAPEKRISTILRAHLPERLATRLQEEASVVNERTAGQLRREERQRLLEVLARYRLPWTGDEGYRKAEVTGGGVVLGEVNPRTMESRVRPGLFLCGEILDAFGPIGGYNFAWAWATGRAAGLGAVAYARA